MRIILIEDSPSLSEVIGKALQRESYAVDYSDDGGKAERILATQDYDLIILDLGLPSLDGLTLLKKLRQRGNKTPVLILTAQTDTRDRVAGLDRGADDYLSKPFEMDELLARIRALLRRGRNEITPLINHGPITFDTVSRQVFIEGASIDFSPRELGVLEILLKQVGRVISKDRIADHVFSFDDETSPNAIEIYIHRLRKKLAGYPIEIKTIRGLGYLLEKYEPGETLS